MTPHELLDRAKDLDGTDAPDGAEPIPFVTCGELRALAAQIDRLENGLRWIRNHWNEYGPANDFEHTIEIACKPIDINKGIGSVWKEERKCHDTE